MRRIKARGKAESAEKIRGEIGLSSRCAKISSGENRRRGAEATSRRHLQIVMMSHHMTSAGKNRANSRVRPAAGFVSFFDARRRWAWTGRVEIEPMAARRWRPGFRA